jgi:hypothetical protein
MLFLDLMVLGFFLRFYWRSSHKSVAQIKIPLDGRKDKINNQSNKF